jgi:hypothetical protein
MKTVGRPKALLVLTDEEREELVGLRAGETSGALAG